MYEILVFDMWSSKRSYALIVIILVYQGKTGVGKTLGWTTRVQIVLESAQGMV
jgi:hypothetical protein